MTDHRVVIADSGPLIALASVRQVELLRGLFQQVIIPETVRVELERGKPRPGWDLVDRAPWLEVRSPSREPDVLLRAELDPGEAEAIALAIEAPGCTLLLDDLRARRLAADVYRINVIGTLGVLTRARRASLLGSLKPVLDALVSAGVYLSPALVSRVLREVGED